MLNCASLGPGSVPRLSPASGRTWIVPCAKARFCRPVVSSVKCTILETIEARGLFAAIEPQDGAGDIDGAGIRVLDVDTDGPTRSGKGRQINMDGMNEDWLIEYNHFRVGTGSGVLARTFSFDQIIRSNVSGLDDAAQLAIRLPTAVRQADRPRDLFSGIASPIFGKEVSIGEKPHETSGKDHQEARNRHHAEQRGVGLPGQL